MSATKIILRRRARKERKQAQTTRTRIWSSVWLTLALIGLVVPLAILLGGAAIVYADAIDGLPTPVETTFVDSEGITRLVDSSGRAVLMRVSDPLGNTREWTRVDALPQHVIDATLVVEDSDFLETTSFDLTGTLARLWRNIMDGPRPDASYGAAGRTPRAPAGSRAGQRPARNSWSRRSNGGIPARVLECTQHNY